VNKDQTQNCWDDFVKWNDGDISGDTVELWYGWKSAYTFLAVNNKIAFDEMLNEMYNSYKQENSNKEER
jgi:hypothetical protein